MRWDDVPPATLHQVQFFLKEVRNCLADNLAGVYLHGSLAMGGFNPASSDVDVLVVVRRALTAQVKRRLIALLLNCSARPHPIEIHFLTLKQLRPWRYPAPFELHFSEDWRERFSHEEGSVFSSLPKTDSDLAAHITVVERRGICLWGMPIKEVFPQVPAEHYLDSILGDLRWAQERLETTVSPVYALLNACRVLAYLQTAQVLSKEEGGLWASEQLPEGVRAGAEWALQAYRSSSGTLPAENFPGWRDTWTWLTARIQEEMQKFLSNSW